MHGRRPRAAGEARDRGYAHLTDVRAKALAQSCLSPFKTGHVRFSARTAPQRGLFQTFWYRKAGEGPEERKQGQGRSDDGAG